MNALAGKRVLVVDDDALLAFDLETFLEGEGCVVLGPASTAEAALALLAGELPDAALLDLALGGGTSAPVADALAARGVGFLFVSGHTHAMLPTAHADRPLLAKPWSEADLRGKLTKLLG
jgi:CheY-like chemotaxis protein